LVLAKAKALVKRKTPPLRLVRSAVHVCLDIAEFVRDRMTALRQPQKAMQIKTSIAAG
jgi:hypothetical protein